ncbi:glycosyltransferase [Kocuria rosea]|uniref:Glycosyl transferase n=1 Tax=Kocuria rosea subsp. polaris TaxID=136273 RepID=A0A0A6VPN1_KOCRO|nr:glycosyltransferase [Kocuria polaris]KHD96348.1 glycosyl transferase [Kocuria polaris]
MRMMLLTAGTRGDVEPFAALARFAAGHGHDVRLGLPDSSGVDLSGLDTVSLEVDFHRLVQEHGISPWTAVRHFRTEVGPGMRWMLAAAVRETLAFAPDVVVHHPKVLTAPAVAQALGAPHVVVEAVPVLTPTRRFPAPGVVNRDLGRFNRATYAVARGAERMFGRDIDRACAQLPGGRPAAVPAPAATLLPISPQLLPRPADWPASVHLTGSWHTDGPVPELEPAVREFLRGGAYLLATFGSMASGDALARGRAVVESARAHGLRTLLLTGWGGLALPDDLRGDVLAVPSLPLDAVLPGAELAVHHGGAGTVHTVARAGVPHVVVPFLADQPFWGRQLHSIGLAAAPIPQKKLTAERLTAAIGGALGCRPAAERVGLDVRKERGLEAALSVLTSC